MLSVCHFDLLEEIGRGAAGVYLSLILTLTSVKLAYDKVKKSYAAVKILPIPASLKEKKNLAREIDIHRSIAHFNIIQFYLATEDDLNIYIALELASGGELFDRIAPDYGVGEELAHLYFTQLYNGLVYLHSRGISHRDIKPGIPNSNLIV
jgi:serine/threonine-protein kinase Chk1